MRRRTAVQTFTETGALRHASVAIVLAVTFMITAFTAVAAVPPRGEVVLPVGTLWGQEKLLYVNTKIPPCEQGPADTGSKELLGVAVGCPAVAVGQLINYWFENGQANGWLDTMLQGVEVYPRPWSFGGIGQAACTHPGFLTEDSYESASWNQVKRFLWHVGIGLDTNYDQSISGLKPYLTERLTELICPPLICGTFESPETMASLLADRFRFGVIEGPSRKLTRLDDASEVIVAAIIARRPVLLMLGQGPYKPQHMALIQGYRDSVSGGLSRYDFQVNFGWGAGYPARWIPGGGPFATDEYTWKEFWVIDVAPVSSGPLNPFVAVGSYSNFRFTAEHQSGAGVDLWRDGPTLVGLFSYSEGLAYDTPTGRLEEVSFDPNTGRLLFTARLTIGEHYCKVHNAVPSQDLFRFSGVLADRSLSGTLRYVDNLHPEVAPSKEQVVLQRSDGEPAIRYSSREQWESDLGPILKFRGPRW